MEHNLNIDVLREGIGYIKLIESWGSDERIIESARMSTSKSTEGWEPSSWWHCDECGHDMRCDHNDKTRTVEHVVSFSVTSNTRGASVKHPMNYVQGHNGDARLLRYLYEHKHFTPFEMAGAIIEVQAPIFVFREWHRHRTQSYNELSARYTPLPDLFYMPTDERLMMSKQSATNKQSSEAATFTVQEIDAIRLYIEGSYRDARATYEELLRRGLSREVARIVIPVGQVSRMRASANLRNWLQFLTLRMDESAQWEIRCYANALHALLKQAFPRTIALFNEGNK